MNLWIKFYDSFLNCLLVKFLWVLNCWSRLQEQSQFGCIKSPRDERVLQVLGEVDRAEFLPVPFRQFAYLDMPVPIIEALGINCTMPSLVALMADLLEFREGQNVLEIGTGCGYSAAITKHLIGNGRLTTIEILFELHLLARRNLQKHFGSISGIAMVCGDGSIGYPSSGPYQRIYFTAAPGLNFNYQILFRQLAKPGILLFPVAPTGDLVILRKDEAGKLSGGAYQNAVSFVHLQGTNR